MKSSNPRPPRGQILEPSVSQDRNPRTLGLPEAKSSNPLLGHATRAIENVHRPSFGAKVAQERLLELVSHMAFAEVSKSVNPRSNVWACSSMAQVHPWPRGPLGPHGPEGPICGAPKAPHIVLARHMPCTHSAEHGGSTFHGEVNQGRRQQPAGLRNYQILLQLGPGKRWWPKNWFVHINSSRRI